VLLLGDRQLERAPIAAATDAAGTDPLVFKSTTVPAGDYLVRLRVDGVDSHLIVDRTETPPVFDATQRLVVP
jgi:hypothetical protein